MERLAKFISHCGFVALLTFAACQSTGADPDRSPQAVVDSVAKQHPDCTRLTVHCTKPSASGPTVCASTAAERVGRPSDPEDLKAMQSGDTVVLEEAGGLDVTVPILVKDGKYSAACGVTMKTDGMTRDQVIAKAKAIAKSVEAELASCCGDGGCCSPK